MSDEASHETSSQPEWFVMIEGEREGPYSLGALQELISIGRIDGDSSVIRAGTSETLSFAMVDELRPLLEDAPLKDSFPPLNDLHLDAPTTLNHTSDLNLDAATQVTSSSLYEQLQRQEAAPRQSLTPNTIDLDQALLEVASMAPPPPDHDPPPVPTAAAVRPIAARRDMFRKDTPRGLFAPQPDDVAPTAPHGATQPATARVGRVHVPPPAAAHTQPVSGTIPLSERPTGTRNEDSLLFKIVESGGRVTAATPAEPESANAPEPETISERPIGAVASADSSGLLDISALANNAAKVKPRTNKLDDILTVGSANLGVAAGTLQSPLLAPVPSRPPPAPAAPTAAPPAFNKTVVYTAAIVSVIVTVGIGAVQVLLHQMDSNRPAQVVVAQPPTLPPVEPAVPQPTPSQPVVAQPAQPVVAQPAIPQPTVPTPPDHVTAPPPRPVQVAQNTPAPTAPPRPRVATPRPAAPPAPTPEHTARVAPPPPPPPPTPAVDPNLPDRPSRDVVGSALNDVAVIVRACGIQSQVQVTITFAGSGRVTTASVGAPYAGTDIGSCVARAVRGARLPAFRDAPFNVVFPFRP